MEYGRLTPGAARVMASLVAVLVLATAVMSAKAAGTTGTAGNGVVGYVKGRLLVKARPGLPEAVLDRELRAFGAKRVGAIPQIGVQILSLPANANEQAMAKALSKNPRFKFAELDLAVRPSLITNDPYLSSAWHLAKVNAPAAWDGSTGQAVTIAILDTGVNPSHVDLAANLVPGWNVYDNSANTSDVYGHGTEVAGVAAAVGNNVQGSAGVSWQSRIMPIRISAPDGLATYSAMAAGITWAADHGAKVANISYEGVAGSSTVSAAAAYMRSRGGVVVAAAGNTGVEQTFPVDDNLTSVSATDSADNKTSWSSYGKYVDIAAPGVGIYTTTNSGSYGTPSGTSFSSPIVAGTYALMAAANPNLSPANLDQALFGSAVDLGAAGVDPYFGAGRVDASAAVAVARRMTAADTSGPVVAIASPSPGATIAGTVGVDVGATDPSGVSVVELYAGNTFVGADNSSPYQFALDTTTVPDGSLSLVARATDAYGNQSSSPVTDVMVANDTTPPVVSILEPAGGATVSGTVSVSVAATDNKQVAKVTLLIDGSEVAVSYGSTLAYAWSVSGTSSTARGKGGGGGGKGGGKRTKTAGVGTATLTATAQDSSGNRSSTSVTVTTQ
ncbi:MAG: S8 family serine peptidase [Betaproteobacteria bacterium]|nr:S8 family serine peptidase [Betaproteobacteria bacterium]